jgi:hypothetical protein
MPRHTGRGRSALERNCYFSVSSASELPTRAANDFLSGFGWSVLGLAAIGPACRRSVEDERTVRGLSRKRSITDRHGHRMRRSGSITAGVDADSNEDDEIDNGDHAAAIDSRT